MKSKAPLALMEQMVMIAVFALAAALCLQVFVLSHTLSVDGANRDRAVTAVQNMAEALKLCRGDYEAAAQLLGGETAEEGLCIRYDEKWQQTSRGQEAFSVQACALEQNSAALGGARIAALAADQEVLFEMNVCWQEDADE